MPYILNKTNGSVVATVADGSINQTTDLTFVGKNYAGYGEIINENLLKLLENFSNATPPAKVIMGQLYYSSTDKKLKVWDGTDFRTFPHVIFDVKFPTKSLNNGDLFFHSSQQKLYIRNSNASSGYTFIGPSTNAGTGSSSGSSIVATSITDTNAGTHPAYIHTINPTLQDSTPTLIVSEDPAYYTNDAAINSNKFNYIRPGINLPNVENGVSTPGTGALTYYFHGSATDALKLGGETADKYLLRADFASASDVTNGYNVASDPGVLVGTNGVFRFHANSGSSEGMISAVAGTKISFNLIYPAITSSTTTNILNIFGNQLLPNTAINVDIGAASTSSRFRAVYAKTVDATTVTATTLVGPLTGNVTGNVTGNLSGNVTGNVTGDTSGTHTGNVTSQVITTGGTLVGGTITGQWSLAYGSTLQATYADLAERYHADAVYEEGTVLVVGGDNEVTISQNRGDYAVAGIVSTNPAYMLNSDAGSDDTHPYIALTGRVPCKVVGPINKSDPLVTSNVPGHACAFNDQIDNPCSILGIALESYAGGAYPGVIEVKV